MACLDSAQLTAGRFGADHPAQVALKDLDLRALAAPGQVGCKPRNLRRAGSRCAGQRPRARD
jgi:hypothetical protein